MIGTNTPHVLNETVADLALALMLTTARRIPELDRLTKAGGWKPAEGMMLILVWMYIMQPLELLGWGELEKQ